MSIVLVLVILVGGFFVAINLVKPETVQGEIAKIVQNMTGKPLHVAQIPSISFMPLGVKFDAVTWGEKKGTDTSFSAKGGFVKMQFLPLLSGRVVVDEVHLDSPILNIVPPKAVAKTQTETQTTLPQLPLELAKLEVKNGQFIINLSQSERIQVSDFNAILTNLKPNATIQLKLDTLLDMANPSLKGKVDFESSIAYDANNIMLSNVKLLYTPQAGLIPASMGILDVSSQNLSVAISEIPSIKGKINLKDIKLDALVAQNEAGGSKSAKKSTTKTIYPQLDLALNVAQATWKTLIVKDVFVHVKGQGGTKTSYDFDPFKLVLASGGSVDAKSKVQLPSMQLQKSGTLKALRVEPVLMAIQGKSLLDAVVDMQWNLSMNANSASQVMKTLGGRGKISATNIILKEGVAIPNNPIIKPASFKEFSQLTIPFEVKNGIVNINAAKLEGQGISANAGGNISLPAQSLDLRVDASALGMVIPLNIGGTFSKPSYGIDPKWLAKSLVNLPANIVKGGVGVTESVGKESGNILKNAGEKSGQIGKEAGKLIKGLFGN